MKIADNKVYAWILIIERTIGLIPFIGVLTYLCCMTFSIQALFRKYGHINSHLGEIFISMLFLLYNVFLLALYVEPVVIFRVYVGDYECSQEMVNFLAITNKMQLLFRPLIGQIIFFMVMWQLITV